jgi:hypothetical protein
VKKRSGLYPRLTVHGAGRKVVPGAGGVLLTRTASTVGLDAALSAALTPWRRPFARHDPGKIVLDLALSLAMGGDCLADVAQLRAHPQVFGPVASDPTVSRCIDTLAADATAALAAIDAARATVRARAWAAAGEHAPDREADVAAPLVIDVDATLVTAHSEKESAAPTFKRGFGFHPLWAFVDHGPEGTGEPLAVLLRAGNAGSNTVADHIAIIRAALAQLPGYGPAAGGRRPGKNVLIRVDAAGGTHGLIEWLTRRRLSYSVGFPLPGDADSIQKTLAAVPAAAWTPAYDAEGQVRPGAWVAELTELFDLSGWPKGMRLICARSAPIRARSCGSPTATGIGSPRSSPTARAGSWPISSCGTAAGPAPRTASAAPRTAGWPICRCTTSRKTRSGARSSPSPAIWSHGCRRWR